MFLCFYLCLVQINTDTGGEAIVDVGLADDQHEWGSDAVIDEWMIKLWKTLMLSHPTPVGVS